MIGDHRCWTAIPTGMERNSAAVDARTDCPRTQRPYQAHAFKILDPSKTELAFNSTGCDKFSSADMIKLDQRNTNVARIARNGGRFSTNATRRAIDRAPWSV